MIYENSNGAFTLFQELSLSVPYAGAITDDHEWVVFGTDDGNMYVFKFNGESYIENQKFNLASGQARDIALT